VEYGSSASILFDLQSTSLATSVGDIGRLNFVWDTNSINYKSYAPISMVPVVAVSIYYFY